MCVCVCETQFLSSGVSPSPIAIAFRPSCCQQRCQQFSICGAHTQPRAALHSKFVIYAACNMGQAAGCNWQQKECGRGRGRGRGGGSCATPTCKWQAVPCGGRGRCGSWQQQQQQNFRQDFCTKFEKQKQNDRLCHTHVCVRVCEFIGNAGKTFHFSCFFFRFFHGAASETQTKRAAHCHEKWAAGAHGRRGKRARFVELLCGKQTTKKKQNVTKQQQKKRERKEEEVSKRQANLNETNQSAQATHTHTAAHTQLHTHVLRRHSSLSQLLATAAASVATKTK